MEERSTGGQRNENNPESDEERSTKSLSVQGGVCLHDEGNETNDEAKPTNHWNETRCSLGKYPAPSGSILYVHTYA